MPSDCASGLCAFFQGASTLTCRPSTCTDTVQAGDETDIDCGGACGASCASGKKCHEENDCTPSAACDNSHCVCKQGYEAKDGACVDVDECALSLDNCDPLASCTNLPGSFACLCGTGYQSNGRLCADVNECEDGHNGGCDVNALCQNLPGSFTCTCATGYTGDGHACTDLNECEDGHNGGCDVHAACANLPGSFTCTCTTGYQGDGYVCNDVNECDDGHNGGCDVNADCHNLPGGVSCTCKDGFTTSGQSCNDVNECDDGHNGGCDENADCHNLPGTFSCTCKAGFLGDGTICHDAVGCTVDPGTGEANCPDPIWVTGTYGTCTSACGGGFHSRVVECRYPNGASAPESRCAAAFKPTTTDSCNTEACAWVTGAYGSCSATCGGGVQTRDVECFSPAGAVEPATSCTDEMPVAIRECNSDPCPVWSTGSYGACSVTCGGGSRTRTVTCTTPGGDPLPEASCTEPKPTTLDTCNNDPCPIWVTGNYGTCSAVCGGGTQTRTATCMTLTGDIVPDTSCIDPRPTTMTGCNPAACTWLTGNYGTCSAVCNGGTQTRTATCLTPEGVPTADVNCTETKPVTAVSCNVDACTWSTGSYGSCSTICNGGVQARTVTCQTPGGASTDDANCLETKPSAMTACNTAACTWSTSSYGNCSMPCNGGTQTRDVTCLTPTGTAANDTNCLEGKPATTATCNSAACSWATGNYGTCSAQCGTGTQTRTVGCQTTAGDAEPDAYCSEEKPTTTQTCSAPTLCASWVTGSYDSCSCTTSTQTRTVTCQYSDGTTAPETACTGAKPVTTSACTPPAACNNFWYTSNYSPCPNPCIVAGTKQTRSVFCTSAPNFPTLADSECSLAGLKPATQRLCC